MEAGERTEENPAEKISVLNTILESVISDTSGLVKDLYWGVKTYLFFGLIEILFGIQQIVYNIDLLEERLYIPLFIAGVMIFAGSAQIINYFRLRKKYSRLFEVQTELRKS